MSQQEEAYRKAMAYQQGQDTAKQARRQPVVQPPPPPQPPRRVTRRSSLLQPTNTDQQPPEPPATRRTRSMISSVQLTPIKKESIKGTSLAEEEGIARRTRSAAKKPRASLPASSATTIITKKRTSRRHSTTAAEDKALMKHLTSSHRRSMTSASQQNVTRASDTRSVAHEQGDEPDDSMEIDYDSDAATATPCRATTSKRTLSQCNSSNKKAKKVLVSSPSRELSNKRASGPPKAQQQPPKKKSAPVQLNATLDPPPLVSEILPPPPPLAAPTNMPPTMAVQPPPPSVAPMPLPPARVQEEALVQEPPSVHFALLPVQPKEPSTSLPRLHSTPRPPRVHSPETDVLSPIAEDEPKLVYKNVPKLISPDNESIVERKKRGCLMSSILALVVLGVAVSVAVWYNTSPGAFQNSIRGLLEYKCSMPGLVHLKVAQAQQLVVDSGLQDHGFETWNVVKTTFIKAKKYLALKVSDTKTNSPIVSSPSSDVSTNVRASEETALKSQFALNLLIKWSHLHACSLNGNPFNVEYDANGSLFPIDRLMDDSGWSDDNAQDLFQNVDGVRIIHTATHGWLVGLQDAPTECDRSMG